MLAGGTTALSQTVEDQIADLLPDADIQRMAGATRTETARLVNQVIRDLDLNRPALSGNTASGDRASVSGGLNNTASGNWASILGGENVIVSTDKATSP